MKALSNRDIINAVVDGKVFNCSMRTGKAVKHTSFKPESETDYLQDTGVKLQKTRLATDLRLMRNKGWQIDVRDHKVISLKRDKDGSAQDGVENNS